MYAKLNAAPKAIKRGINDQSPGEIPPVAEALPIHLPHVFDFAPEGPETPQLVSGSELQRLFGDEALSLRSKYTTHQTPLIQTLISEGNAVVYQRVKPSDAGPPARVRVSLEMVLAELDVYERDADGNVNYDENGDPITTGTTEQGQKARWILEDIATESDFGAGTSQAGDLTGLTGEESTVYPIFDIEVSSFGKKGNDKGFRIWAPTLESNPQADEDLINDQQAFAYEFQAIERSGPTARPEVVETLSGAQSVQFMLKPEAFDDRLNQEKYIDDILLDAYRDSDSNNPALGPFGRFHTYQSNIETVATTVYNVEQPNHSDWPTDAAEGLHLINLVGGRDLDGNPYHLFRLEGAAGGGVEFTRFSNHYARGGADGTLDANEFDTQVAAICEGYGTSEYNFTDKAMWPQSIIYDSGFTQATKKKMLTPLGVREDIAIILSTQDVQMPQNDVDAESSILVALRTAAENYPESEIFGTPVSRAAIVQQSGQLLDSPYSGLTPMTIEIAGKMARYMGRGDGNMRTSRAIDQSPYNQITRFKADTVNVPWRPRRVYENDWANGAIWAQTYDRRSLFFPAYQTVYDDSTSVLNSLVNMAILVELQKVADRVWRDLVGNTQLTPSQFAARSDEMILDRTEGRFDGRVVIEPNTYFTDIDEALGYAWSTDITVYMNNMRTVGTYTIISRRRADLNG